MNYNVISYAIYLPITIGLTVWVANTLLKNGRVFLNQIFHGDSELSASVSKLLQVGFYLVNIGYVIIALQTYRDLQGVQDVVETLSEKIGAILLILGAMHFMNMFILFRLRKRAQSFGYEG